MGRKQQPVCRGNRARSGRHSRLCNSCEPRPTQSKIDGIVHHFLSASRLHVVKTSTERFVIRLPQTQLWCSMTFCASRCGRSLSVCPSLTTTTWWSHDTVERTVASTQKSVAHPATNTRRGARSANISFSRVPTYGSFKVFSITTSLSRRVSSGRKCQPAALCSKSSPTLPQCLTQITVPSARRTIAVNTLIRSIRPRRSCLGGPSNIPICMSTMMIASISAHSSWRRRTSGGMPSMRRRDNMLVRYRFARAERAGHDRTALIGGIVARTQTHAYRLH
jgi:hypothetical protein